MRIKDAIDLAKSSKLKQLAIKLDDKDVIGFINLAVLELHKVFALKELEAVITLQEGKTQYLLDGTDTDVALNANYELLFITACYDEQGDPVVINNEDDMLGVNTPSYDTVEVPAVAQDEKLSILYRATPVFASNILDKLKIPPQLLEALLNYVAYEAHSSLDGSIKGENNTHYMRFISSCKNIKDLGLMTADDLESKSFELRGFV